MPLPTTHEQLLADEGYSGPRWVLSGAIERRLYGHFGVGLLGLWGWRSLGAPPREGANEFSAENPPRYSESYWIAAVELPLTFQAARLGRSGQSWVELSLVPWLGVGGGSLDVHGEESWQPGFAFGCDGRLLFRGRHGGAGFAVGAPSLKLVESSIVGGSVNLGMISFSLLGGFDVG